MPRSLRIVGTGICAGAETTPEAQAAIRSADKVFYLVADSLTATWIEQLNPSAQSLFDHYIPDVVRGRIYETIVETLLAAARRERVCAAFYGHPGVFAYPGHEAIRRARLEGIDARMLAGVSAEDRLFADLGVDPAAQGMQSYEATSFLIYRPRFDSRAGLILWQIGAIGNLYWKPDAPPRNVDVLARYLQQSYRAEHEVFVYEAPQDPVSAPVVQRVTLEGLLSASITFGSTLYVPPSEAFAPDEATMQSIGIDLSDWATA